MRARVGECVCACIWLCKHTILWKQPLFSRSMVCQELRTPCQDTSPLFALSIPQGIKEGARSSRTRHSITLELRHSFPGSETGYGYQASIRRQGLFTSPSIATYNTQATSSLPFNVCLKAKTLSLPNIVNTSSNVHFHCNKVQRATQAKKENSSEWICNYCKNLIFVICTVTFLHRKHIALMSLSW